MREWDAMAAREVTMEEFLALPRPRFVKVRDRENPWRIAGRSLVAGYEYEVEKRDGTTVTVRVERVTAHRPNGEAMAKFSPVRAPWDSYFARCAAEEAGDVDSQDADCWSDFGAGWDGP